MSKAFLFVILGSLLSYTATAQPQKSPIGCYELSAKTCQNIHDNYYAKKLMKQAILYIGKKDCAEGRSYAVLDQDVPGMWLSAHTAAILRLKKDKVTLVTVTLP